LEATALHVAATEMEELVKGKPEGSVSDKELWRKFEDLKDALKKALEAVQTLRSPAEKEAAKGSGDDTVSLPPELAKKAAGRIEKAAEMGDLIQIKSIAEALKSESGAFLPVCNKFIQLAENFDLDGILNLARELYD
jgi:hypothetical protein